MNISGQQELVVESCRGPKGRLRSFVPTCGQLHPDQTRPPRFGGPHFAERTRLGRGAFAMLTRLLSQKLSLCDRSRRRQRLLPHIAVGGSRVSPMRSTNLNPQTGQLFHYDEYAFGQNGLHVGSLLGATLIGMKAGVRRALPSGGRNIPERALASCRALIALGLTSCTEILGSASPTPETPDPMDPQQLQITGRTRDLPCKSTSCRFALFRNR
jgi:hypothetical protein